MSGSEDRESVMNQLVNRTKMWLAGITHYGRRDLYALFGYNRWPRQLDFAARYLRQDIAKRCMDAPILATWADPPELQADDAFMEAWNNLIAPIDPLVSEANVPIFHNLIRLDRLAALGSFAVMVFGFDDGGKLDQPVKPKDGMKLLYLQPYAEMAVKVLAYDRSTSSPRFGKPVMYQIQPGRFTPNIRIGGITAQYTSEDRTPFNCHYTRILHVAENLLEDSVFGRSRMEVIVNLLDDILKVGGGCAETYWLTANRGMHVNVDKDMDLDEDSADDLSKEIDEYHHDMRRFIRTRGVEISELGSKVADPSGVFNLQLSLLSAATGIPKMVLIGSTTGQMASQQDRASWAERVMERITEYSEPIVFIPFIRHLITAQVLPKPVGLEINWPEAFKLSPLERAQTSAQMARSAANLNKTQADIDPGSPGTPDTTGPNGETIPGEAPTPPTPPPNLFTRDEMRQIVSFGKRVPVFDNTTNSPSGTGSGSSSKTKKGGPKKNGAGNPNEPAKSTGAALQGSDTQGTRQ